MFAMTCSNLACLRLRNRLASILTTLTTSELRRKRMSLFFRQPKPTLKTFCNLHDLTDWAFLRPVDSYFYKLSILIATIMPKFQYYAVADGRQIGIFDNWSACQSAVSGYSGAKYKGFHSYEEAEEYVQAGPSMSGGMPSMGGAAGGHVSRGGYDFQFVDAYSLAAAGHSGGGGRRLEIYTDGACTNNGYGGARAGIGVFFGHGDPRNISCRLRGRQTNNRAEIMAVVMALDEAREAGHNAVQIYTDSSFTIKGVTEWMQRWKQNGWRLATGGPVKNQEEFMQLDEAMQGMDVEFTHVKGHAGIVGNEMADQLANAGAGMPY